MSTNTYHTSVLLNECIEGLAINPQGVYVDVTFGGGGHSKGILSMLGPEGRLIAFDQDADAQQNLPKDDRLIFIPENLTAANFILQSFDYIFKYQFGLIFLSS